MTYKKVVVRAIAAKAAHHNETVVEPGPQDFVFVGAGGHWQKVRKQTAWNSAILKALAIQYRSLCDNKEKQKFVNVNIIQQVKRQGGRFLTGHYDGGDATTSRYICWSIVDDPDEVRDGVMRILRQLGARITNHQVVMQETAQGVQQLIGTLQQELDALQDTVQPVARGKRPAPKTWKHMTAKAVQKKLRRLVEQVTDCQEKLSPNNGLDSSSSTSSLSTLTTPDDDTTATTSPDSDNETNAGVAV